MVNAKAMVSIPFPMAKDMKENGFKTSNMGKEPIISKTITDMKECGITIISKEKEPCSISMEISTLENG